MSKYINSEKLIAEIERLKSTLADPLCSQGNIIGPDWVAGGNKMLKEISSIIDTLQQEQPEVDLEIEIQSFWNANALAYRLGHVADINFLAYTARHFAEWGAIHLNARKEK